MARPMAALLDIEIGFLSLCLSKLPAHTQGAVVCTCKLFAVLVSEARLDSTFLESVVDISLESALAGLTPKLVSPPSVGMVFATSEMLNNSQERKDSVRKLVCSLPPALHLVGAQVETLVGTCPDSTLSVRRDGGFALSLGCFPEAEVSSFALTGNTPMEEQLAAQGVLTPGWKVIVVMTTVHCQELLTLLQATHPDAAIIGGIVQGEWMFRAHAHKVQFIRRGVIGLMFRGNCPLSALVCQGRHKASERLQRVRQEIAEQGKTVLGAIMFTCCARDEEADAKAFTSTFPCTPLAGMPCGGEIGPDSQQDHGSVTQVGNTTLQGFTAVYGLFSHPVRTRAAPPNFERVDEAYSQSRSRPAAVAAAAAVEKLKALPDGHNQIEVEEIEGCSEHCSGDSGMYTDSETGEEESSS